MQSELQFKKTRPSLPLTEWRAIMLLTGFTPGLSNASLPELYEANFSPATPHLRAPTVFS